MADTWPNGDPLERKGGVAGFFTGLANAVGAGASSGFGLGDASSGMAGGAAEGSRVREGFADRLKQGAQDAVLSQYPGYQTLWTYGAGGVQVLPSGWLAIGAAGLGLWLLMGGR